MKSVSNKKIKAIVVVGARPNFMKAAPVLRAMKKSGKFYPVLVHTGQHYDFLMSEKFFQDLNMPKPDVYLGIGSGSDQIAKIMLAITPHLQKIQPNVAIVVGDVNSTVAAALAAKKLGIKVAHVEAGLRSFDETMPEEINRVITDRISDFLFTTEESGNINLRDEGIAAEKIHFVGNTMIDSLLANLKKIRKSDILKKLNIGKPHAVLTLHRPANVDDKKSFQRALTAINKIKRNLPIIFPIHPRTRKNAERFGFAEYFTKNNNLVLTEPLGYIDFMKAVDGAKFVLTDSGGIQEETTALGIPCVTLRKTTERPVTADTGTNIVVGEDFGKAVKIAEAVLAGRAKKGRVPKYWDGKAAERIVKILAKNL